jgi:hypothetical protein
MAPPLSRRFFMPLAGGIPCGIAVLAHVAERNSLTGKAMPRWLARGNAQDPGLAAKQ